MRCIKSRSLDMRGVGGRCNIKQYISGISSDRVLKEKRGEEKFGSYG